ncbi:hypothetical protein GCM10009839_45210 [Catenulispora yoronensis]|uniref:HTH marR-type domain-containing protein n=2 Tax=Catenulispora yoronensis TaxID=450799 RepID=A0ABN2UIU5_9ACTN
MGYAPGMTTPAPKPLALRRRLPFALVTLATAARRDTTQALAGSDLGIFQHAVLCVLAESGPLIQKDAAARLGIDSGDMVAYVDDLLASGSVDKQRDPADRRRQILEITPKGRRVLAKAERDLDASTEETFGALSPEEREVLYGLLVRVLAQRDPEGWPDEDQPPAS